MRTTLHMVPLDIASILHMATLDLRLAECRLFCSRNNIDINFIKDIREELIDFVDSEKSSNEIESKILDKLFFCEIDLKKECAKKILKYLWEEGVFCYVNTADNWENEERKYSITKKFYPNLDLEKYSTSDAQRLLVYEYIKKFGPATLKDLSWWSGLSKKTIKKIIDEYHYSIIEFKINNFESSFYVLEEEYHKLEQYKTKGIEWVTLLAYEDPSLKGYYESRSRYVNKEYYNLLFNQIGEVRASIIYNGKAIGIWEWDKKQKHIILQYFSNPASSIKREVKRIKEYYENILCPNRQITLFDGFL